jgi:WD40 repeat protein
MRLRFVPLIIFVFIQCLLVSGQNPSCLEMFKDFDILKPTVNPTERNQDYQPVMAWYRECIVIGSSSGLWLYDLGQPENAVRLAWIEDRAIDNVAVNPKSLTIAFNVAHEPIVYLIHSDAEVSTIAANGQAVTDISFSDDGNLMAVASSDIEDYEGTGFYYDARVQIWNANSAQAKMLSSDVQVIVDTFVTTDGSGVLIHGINSGYIGDVVEFWDLETTSRLWDYRDLLKGLDEWSLDDPMAVLMVESRNHTLALGGLDGYHDWDEYYGTAVHIWDAESRTRSHEIVIHRRGTSRDSYLTSLALNSDGSIVATAQHDGTVRLWNTQDGLLLGEFTAFVDGIYQLLFSPNNELLGVLGDEMVIVLDTDLMEEIAAIRPHNTPPE